MKFCSKKSGKWLLVLLIPLFSITSTYSQNFSPNSSFVSHWQLEVDAGSSLFFGDIKQYQWWPVSNYENEWRAAFGIQLKKQISPVFAINGQGVYGQLAGTRRAWSKYFENDYFEFNVNTHINLINIFSHYRNGRIINPFLVFGIGLNSFNTEVYELGTNKLIQSVGNGSGRSFGGRTLEGVLLGGLGVDIRLNERWDLTLKSVNRYMNSDILDGYVSQYPYDVYNITSIGIVYKFGYSNKHNSSPKSHKSAKVNKVRVDEIETVEYDYGEQPIESPVVQPEILYVAPYIVPQTEEKVEEVAVIEEEIVEEEVVEEILPTFEYRVQIRAKLGQPVSISHLSNLYNIPQNQIRQNMHNGYFIYSVGSFATYEEAKNKRNEIRSKNGIPDAFVVAFNNGVRTKLPKNNY